MRYLATLPEALIREACAQSHSYWGGSRSLEDYTSRNLSNLTRGAGLVQFAGVVDEHGALQSALKRYTIHLSFPETEKPIKAVGLGAIFTAAQNRRKGAASVLIRETLSYARQEGAEAALLFSDIAPSYYERFGFAAYPAIDRSLLVSELPLEGALSMRPITEAEEAACHQLCARSSLLEGARTAPSLEEWRFFRWRNAKNPALVLWERSSLVGYALLEADHDALWVNEWVAPNIPRDQMLATLRAAATGQNLSRIEGWLPKIPGLPWRETTRTQAIPMLASLQGAPLPKEASFWSVDHF